VPQRDRYHDAVRRALVKDGWTITHDPLTVPAGLHNVYVDLGAERLLAAERGSERIAVEVKVFGGRSEVASLEHALGQYMLYRVLLRRVEPDRRLVLAVPDEKFDGVLSSELGRAVRDEYALVMLVFDPVEEVIRKWLP
jgi:hypothetical protein